MEKNPRSLIEKGSMHKTVLGRSERFVIKTPSRLVRWSPRISAATVNARLEAAQKLVKEIDGVEIPNTRVQTVKNSYRIIQEFIPPDTSIPNPEEHLKAVGAPSDLLGQTFVPYEGTLYWTNPINLGRKHQRLGLMLDTVKYVKEFCGRIM